MVKKALKRLLATVVISIAGLAALVAVFAAIFDLNSYKPQLEEIASGLLEQPVHIAGDAKLGMEGGLPSVVLNAVTVGEGKAPLSADKLEASLPLGGIQGSKSVRLDASVTGLRNGSSLYGDFSSPVLIGKKGVTLPEITGASAMGDLKAEASFTGGALHVSAQVSNVDYKTLVEGATGGKANVDILLDAPEADKKGIMPNLKGHVSLVGGEGVLSGRLLEMWGADLMRVLFSGNVAATKINCAVADFTVVEGVAYSRSFLIDTQLMTIHGSGQINLSRNTVNMLFKPVPKSRAFVNLAAPLRVYGPLDNPQVRPDTTAMAERVGGLLLGAVNPAAALLPYFLQETGAENPCVKFLQGKNQ